MKKQIFLFNIKKIIIFFIIIFFINFYIFPIFVSANNFNINNKNIYLLSKQENKIQNNSQEIKEKLPNNKEREIKRISYFTLTAYNSEVAQCDASPCITANGFNLCKNGIEDTIDTNSLRLGIKIRIPNLFGSRVFVVRDRMNERYLPSYNKMDIWMIDKVIAKKFGVKRRIKVEILE